jgi:hypothetical protein
MGTRQPPNPTPLSIYKVFDSTWTGIVSVAPAVVWRTGVEYLSGEGVVVHGEAHQSNLPSVSGATIAFKFMGGSVCRSCLRVDSRIATVLPSV